ncbi:MAG TPA: class I SAM-dependent methyltransferase [Thermoflexales bacterium]|nr:class I SAM-dependent methyltransferase [Thermoflexales bacterium]
MAKRPIMTSKTTLDLGCGKARHPDSIGIDINPDSNADIIHDLNVFPYPFEDNSFDVVFADSIIEHLDDIPSVMNELHRITRSGGKLIVITPYFSSLDAFTDPTHKHFFSMRSFDYFTDSFSEYSYYLRSKFRKTKVKVTFWNLPRLKGIRPQHFLGANFLATRFPTIYERFFAFILPAQEIRFELEVIK